MNIFIASLSKEFFVFKVEGTLNLKGCWCVFFHGIGGAGGVHLVKAMVFPVESRDPEMWPACPPPQPKKTEAGPLSAVCSSMMVLSFTPCSPGTKASLGCPGVPGHKGLDPSGMPFFL